MLSLFESGHLDFLITDESLPESLPLELTTTFLEALLPGLVDKFGSD